MLKGHWMPWSPEKASSPCEVFPHLNKFSSSPWEVLSLLNKFSFSKTWTHSLSFRLSSMRLWSWFKLLSPIISFSVSVLFAVWTLEELFPLLWHVTLLPDIRLQFTSFNFLSFPHLLGPVLSLKHLSLSAEDNFIYLWTLVYPQAFQSSWYTLLFQLVELEQFFAYHSC